MTAPLGPNPTPEEIEAFFRGYLGALREALLSLDPEDGRYFQVRCNSITGLGKPVYQFKALHGSDAQHADYSEDRKGFQLTCQIEPDGEITFSLTDRRHGRFMISAYPGLTAEKSLQLSRDCIHHVVKMQADAFDARLAAGPQMHQVKQAAIAIAPTFSFKPKM